MKMFDKNPSLDKKKSKWSGEKNAFAHWNSGPNLTNGGKEI